MTKPRILVAESSGFSEIAADILRGSGDLELADLEYDALREKIPGVNVLWVRLRNRIDRELIEQANELRILATPTTGWTHIDTGALKQRGAELVSLRGEGEFLRDVRATAELTIALMLNLLRKLPAAISDAKRGNWQRDKFEGGELYGKIVGIIGYGRLGKLVAGYLKAFGAKVLVSDPKIPTPWEDGIVESSSLDTLLKRSDIVSLHADLTDENYGFLGETQLKCMKREACFINTARGELVNEQALLNLLQSGALAGAALDVLAEERSSGMLANPLVAYAATHENLILTPHLGGCTTESKRKTEIFLANKLRDVIKKMFVQ